MQLTTNELMYLKKFFPDVSQFSLFANLENSTDGSEQQALIEKKLIIDDQLIDKAKDLLAIMAEAESVSRVVLKDTMLFIEKYLYRKGDLYVIVENANGELLFSSDQRLEQVIEEFSWYFGNSNLKSTHIEGDFTREETLVLLSIIDLQRQEFHYAYLEGKKPQLFFAIAEIKQHIIKPSSNAITTLLTTNYNMKIAEDYDLTTIVEPLLARGILLFDNGYGLCDDYLTFASQFLIPRIVGVVDVLYNNEQQQINKVEALIVSAGIRDNMAIVFSNEGLEVNSLSANELLALITSLFRQEILKEE